MSKVTTGSCVAEATASVLRSILVRDRSPSGGGVSTRSINVAKAGTRLTGLGMTMCRAKFIVSSVGSVSSMLAVAACSLWAREVGGTASALSANETTLYRLRLAMELIPPHTCLSSNVTTLPLEFVNGDRWESSGAVVLRLMLVHLVHGCGAVHDMRLDCLLVDDRLNMLVDVVVHVLALRSRRLSLRAGGGANLTGMLGQTKTSMLLRECVLDPVVITVTELLVLGFLVDVGVLLRKDLSVLDRLDGSVVMLLVNLLVHWPVYLLMLGGLDVLVLNSGLDMLFW